MFLGVEPKTYMSVTRHTNNYLIMNSNDLSKLKKREAFVTFTHSLISGNNSFMAIMRSINFV